MQVRIRHIGSAIGEGLPDDRRERGGRVRLAGGDREVVERQAPDARQRPHFDEYVSIEGWQHLEAVRGMGRGAIVITGHIGNYDLLAAYMAHKGIALVAAARRFEDGRLNQLLTDLRGEYLRIIPRGAPGAGREILKVIKQRGVLALQLDMDVRVPSVSVPFFGRLARTPAAAAVLAVRRSVPVLPAFARRRPEGGHQFTIMAPILPPESGDRQHDVVELTRQFSRILEDYIRRYPAEWNWWHRRWRRPPVPRLDLDAERPPVVALA